MFPAKKEIVSRKFCNLREKNFAGKFSHFVFLQKMWKFSQNFASICLEKNGIFKKMKSFCEDLSKKTKFWEYKTHIPRKFSPKNVCKNIFAKFR